MKLKNSDSRDYFKKLELSYKDSNEHLNRLKELLVDHFKCHKEFPMRLSKIVHFESEYSTIYLYVNGSYFKRRECISFNRDGFIGFAGWADSNNVQPILKAFNQWCGEVQYLKMINADKALI